jgi:beta-galactosidase
MFMYKLKIAAVCLLTFFIIDDLRAQGQKQSTPVPQRISLDKDWTFSFGNASNPAKDYNYGIANIFAKSGKTENTPLNPKFDDSSWRKLNIPHDWAVELPFVNLKNDDLTSHGYKPVGGLFPETSIGWYRKNFYAIKLDSGKRFELQFDGVFRDATFWLNGFYIGNNKSGYVGVNYDVTDYIQFDKQNVITVRVDATQYEGWFYEGAGIYRHVWLNMFNNTHIPHDGVFVHSKVDDKNATVTVETTIENKDLVSSTASVYSYIVDRNGKQISKSNEQDIKLNVNERITTVQNLELTNVRLWDLDDPYLYRVVSVVRNDEGVLDSTITKYGIRTISIDPAKGFFLNGKHVKLKGTNNHQDHAGVGSALPDYLQYYRIKLLKDFGSNAYRASHNVPTKELLEACDSLGMLVMNEQRLLNSSPEYMDQFERIIKRDRNHPSIFMWSIGNEEGYLQKNSTGKRIAQTLLAKQMELDPYRISTYAADLANEFMGVNEVIPVRSFNYRQFAVADYHRDHPHQALIGTEMGSTVTTRGIYEVDSVRAYVPDQDISAPWWASTAETWWSLAAVNDFWAGGFIWTGFDYRGEPTPYVWPNVNSHFGIMDVCGFPKNIYYYYQSWWTDKDVLHISPHWNWKGKEGEKIDVWVNTNADNVELFLNGKSLGKKDMPRNSHLKWEVVYQPGKLKAVAYKKGKKLEKVVETTTEAYQIVLHPDKKIIKADGKDATVVNVSVVDKKGREVPTANFIVNFKTSGDIKIIGVGNGDPSSHEKDIFLEGDWSRSLFNGKCQVILQAGELAGKSKLEVSSINLRSSMVDFDLVSNYY